MGITGVIEMKEGVYLKFVCVATFRRCVCGNCMHALCLVVLADHKLRDIGAQHSQHSQA